MLALRDEAVKECLLGHAAFCDVHKLHAVTLRLKALLLDKFRILSDKLLKRRKILCFADGACHAEAKAASRIYFNYHTKITGSVYIYIM